MDSILLLLLLLLYQQNLAIDLNVVTVEQSRQMLIQEKTYNDHGFSFKFSDYEYFTNKCMSLGILAINQIVLFLKPKRFQCVSAVFVLWFPADMKLAIASILFNIKCPIQTKFNRNAKCTP